MSKIYEIMDLPQGSPEWHLYRNKAIGASDFSTVAFHAGLCKVNLYKKSNNSIIKDKVRPREVKDNKFYRMGHTYEAKLKEVILQKYPTFIDFVARRIDHTRISASLDGYIPEQNATVELKATTKDISKLEDMIEFYKYQCFHQMYVVGADKCILTVYFVETNVWECREWTREEVSKILPEWQWLEVCMGFLAQLDEMGRLVCPFW
jgi:putative phage-type endonuclease